MCMRSVPGSFHLSFLLPKEITFRPSVDGAFAAPGCTFRITHPLVKIAGPSQRAIFEAATAFLRSLERAPQPVSIAAVISTPVVGAGRDFWSIIVGADIAFSPTGLDAHFPQAVA